MRTDEVRTEGMQEQGEVYPIGTEISLSCNVWPEELS